jgi:hypothetical protein
LVRSDYAHLIGMVLLTDNVKKPKQKKEVYPLPYNFNKKRDEQKEESKKSELRNKLENQKRNLKPPTSTSGTTSTKSSQVTYSPKKLTAAELSKLNVQTKEEFDTEYAKNLISKTRREAYDRFSSRFVDSYTLGVTGELDALKGKDDYREARSFGDDFLGASSDWLATGLGYVSPAIGAKLGLQVLAKTGGKGLIKGAVGRLAGKTLAKPVAKLGTTTVINSAGTQVVKPTVGQIVKRGAKVLGQEAKEDLAIGAMLSAGEIGVREALNGDAYTWQDNAQKLAIDTAMGPLFIPPAKALGKGLELGLKGAGTVAGKVTSKYADYKSNKNVETGEVDPDFDEVAYRRSLDPDAETPVNPTVEGQPVDNLEKARNSVKYEELVQLHGKEKADEIVEISRKNFDELDAQASEKVRVDKAKDVINYDDQVKLHGKAFADKMLKQILDDPKATVTPAGVTPTAGVSKTADEVAGVPAKADVEQTVAKADVVPAKADGSVDYQKLKAENKHIDADGNTIDVTYEKDKTLKNKNQQTYNMKDKDGNVIASGTGRSKAEAMQKAFDNAVTPHKNKVEAKRVADEIEFRKKAEAEEIELRKEAEAEAKLRETNYRNSKEYYDTLYQQGKSIDKNGNVVDVDYQRSKQPAKNGEVVFNMVNKKTGEIIATGSFKNLTNVKKQLFDSHGNKPRKSTITPKTSATTPTTNATTPTTSTKTPTASGTTPAKATTEKKASVETTTTTPDLTRNQPTTSTADQPVIKPVEEIKKGLYVEHKEYGRGQITSIIKAGTMAKIKFDAPHGSLSLSTEYLSKTTDVKWIENKLGKTSKLSKIKSDAVEQTNAEKQDLRYANTNISASAKAKAETNNPKDGTPDADANAGTTKESDVKTKDENANDTDNIVKTKEQLDAEFEAQRLKLQEESKKQQALKDAEAKQKKEEDAKRKLGLVTEKENALRKEMDELHTQQNQITERLNSNVAKLKDEYKTVDGKLVPDEKAIKFNEALMKEIKKDLDLMDTKNYRPKNGTMWTLALKEAKQQLQTVALRIGKKYHTPLSSKVQEADGSKLVQAYRKYKSRLEKMEKQKKSFDEQKNGVVANAGKVSADEGSGGSRDSINSNQVKVGDKTHDLSKDYPTKKDERRVLINGEMRVVGPVKNAFLPGGRSGFSIDYKGRKILFDEATGLQVSSGKNVDDALENLAKKIKEDSGETKFFNNLMAKRNEALEKLFKENDTPRGNTQLNSFIIPLPIKTVGKLARKLKLTKNNFAEKNKIKKARKNKEKFAKKIKKEKGFKDKVTQTMFDHGAPTKRLDADGKIHELNADTVRANNLTSRSIHEDQVDLEGNVIGKSLVAIYKMVGKNTKLLDEFLILRSAISRVKKGDTFVVHGKRYTLENIDEMKDRIVELAKKDKNMMKAGESWDKYFKNIREMMVKEGIWTRNYVDGLEKDNPFYAPLQRDFGENTTLKINKKSKRGGSEAEVLDPKVSTMELTRQYYSLMLRNRVNKEILDGIRQNAELFRKEGFSIEDTTKLEAKNHQEVTKLMTDTFSESLVKNIKNKKVIYAYENGQIIKIGVKDEDMAIALSTLDPNSLKLLNAYVKFLKTGLTGPLAPIFSTGSFVMDTHRAIMRSDEPFKHVVFLIKAMFSVLAKQIPGLKQFGKMVDDYYNAGNGQSYLLKTSPEHRASTTEFESGVTFKKTLKVVNPWDERSIHSRYANTMENMNRMAAYHYKMKKLGGVATKENVRIASKYARGVTTDYTVSGSWVRGRFELASIFTSATIANSTQFFKHVMERPLRAGMGLLFLAFLPKLQEYLRFRDDEGYQNLPASERYNYIYVNKNKDGTFTKIPIDRSYTFPAQFSLDMFESMAKGNPDAFRDVTAQMVNAYLPPIASGFVQGAKNNDSGIPYAVEGGSLAGILNSTSLSPIVSLASNQNYFGQKIIPADVDKNITSTLKYDETTSRVAIEISKWLSKGTGKAMNISPMHIDYIAKQYLGDVARVGLPLTAEAKSPKDLTKDVIFKKFFTDPSVVSILAEKYYKARESLIRAHDENEKNETPLPSWYTERHYNMVNSRSQTAFTKQLQEVKKKRDSILLDKTLTKSQRQEKIKETYAEFNKIYLDAIVPMKELKVPM